MKINESFLLAVKNIWGSKMRSFLTMLGIIIGIAAVMVIIGLGNGMEAYMNDQFQVLGTNTLSVTVTGQGSSRTMSADDMFELVNDNPLYLESCTPLVSMGGTVKIGRETLDRTAVTGVAETYMDIKGYTVSNGRNLHYMDIKQRTKVCVVGSYVADQWFGGNALGKELRLDGNVFTIVGVLEAEEDKPAEGGTDDAVYIPYSTAARLTGMGTINSYTVTIVDENMAAQAKSTLEQALFEIFGTEDAYMVISMTQLLDMMTQMLDVLITVLAIIAGISLVVGGIGIMNIMLVSVSERTKEIGIRKALGAKERYIMTQFVIEAAVTSAIGGGLGIGAGYGLSSLATVLVTAILDVQLSVTPTLGSIGLAFGASAGIGILFGYLPAKKAARLNPIDALRYE